MPTSLGAMTGDRVQALLAAELEDRSVNAGGMIPLRSSTGNNGLMGARKSFSTIASQVERPFSS